MTDTEQKKVFSKNLNKLLSLYGKSQREVANAINVSPQTFNTWCNGIALPRMGKVQLLADYFHINKSDLIEEHTSYSSPDYSSTATPDEFENLVKKYRNLDPYGQETINIALDRETARVTALREQTDKINELETVLRQTATIMRIYTYMKRIACAGTGFYFDDIPTDTIEAPYMEGADFIIGVNGDSMEPDYHDGDNLYIKKTDHINYGEVGIFTINNECFLKEYGKDGLISRNPNYGSIPGSEDVRLIGKVIGKVSDSVSE